MAITTKRRKIPNKKVNKNKKNNNCMLKSYLLFCNEILMIRLL